MIDAVNAKDQNLTNIKSLRSSSTIFASSIESSQNFFIAFVDGPNFAWILTTDAITVSLRPENPIQHVMREVTNVVLSCNLFLSNVPLN